MLETALAGPGPADVRVPRGTLPTTPASIHVEPGPVTGARSLGARTVRWPPSSRSERWGSPRWRRPGALEVATAVLDVRSLAPLDVDRVLEACATGHVVTLEEGTTHGGLGSAVLELAASRGV